VIEEDCWLGGNVCVLPGVTIGRGAVVGAGSVVTKVCLADIFVYSLW
jgi:acetyltransferase-like isoleucine patch superfamily enzyme